MTKVYHVAQLPLFPEKQCTKCLKIFPATTEYFYAKKYRKSYGINSICKECAKASVNRYPTLITLTCETCNKEFTRGKAHQAYQVKKYNRQHIYCSNACNTTLAKEWPDLLGEEYLQGASMNELAQKYGFTASGVRNHLHELGIETGFTDLVRKRMSEIGIERFNDPAEREKVSKRTLSMYANGTMKRSSMLEDRVAIEMSKQGFAFVCQRGIAVPGRQGFIACADFLLANGTIVEVNGTYWHADPRRYPNGPINKAQQSSIDSDNKKRLILAEAGIPVIVLWEMDLEADMAGTISKALGG